MWIEKWRRFLIVHLNRICKELNEYPVRQKALKKSLTGIRKVSSMMGIRFWLDSPEWIKNACNAKGRGGFEALGCPGTQKGFWLSFNVIYCKNHKTLNTMGIVWNRNNLLGSCNEFLMFWTDSSLTGVTPRDCLCARIRWVKHIARFENRGIVKARLQARLRASRASTSIRWSTSREWASGGLWAFCTCRRSAAPAASARSCSCSWEASCLPTPPLLLHLHHHRHCTQMHRCTDAQMMMWFIHML